ncbi:unnamed protein product [Adineta ricciae]|uniref:2-(3-amino-3-carboxypropyl)histidine synthase subunit 1 n=1 Tax=Adineta ricciae TaxID=249248 RepID=A0A815CU67_ADIRI|nr:unnamed protein product [Adineta ricciae]
MDENGNKSSEESDSRCSSVMLDMPVLSYLPRRYDRTLIVPSILSERQSNPYAVDIKLPPLKFSTAEPTSEEEDFLALNPPTTERELTLFKQKFNRLRVTLSKSHEFNLYTCEKVRQKRSDLRRTIREQKKLIRQLITEAAQLNDQINDLRDEITKQCHKRDAHELKQLKLRSKLNHLNAAKGQSIELIETIDKSHVVNECEARLLQLKNECRAEISHRDQQIEQLKQQLIDKFGCRASEHMKAIRATEQACTIEGEKCEKLQEIVDHYEATVYRMSKVRPLNANQIPEELLNDKELNLQIKQLPENYNFEIHKTIWRIKTIKAKRVAMQMPEGLFVFACTIADILKAFTNADVVIMGDVAYGACCIDDYGARALKCDLLIHYGHSCLVPIDETPGISILYIFVDIQVNLQHIVDTLKHHFTSDSKLALVSTIQFVRTLQIIKEQLKEHVADVIMPQTKPLSPGEILGCTSPIIPDSYSILYIGDGRFHIESIMIHNPNAPAFKYDPYSKEFTREYYDTKSMHSVRQTEINKAANGQVWGLVLGSLGRQGSPKVLETIKQRLKSNGKSYIQVVMPELMPDKLKLFKNVDVWIQTSCPRLSIDWGAGFQTPILTPYEAMVALRQIEWQSRYPMDFYAQNSLGPWTPNNPEHRPLRQPRRKIEVAYENKTCSSCETCSNKS